MNSSNSNKPPFTSPKRAAFAPLPFTSTALTRNKPPKNVTKKSTKLTYPIAASKSKSSRVGKKKLVVRRHERAAADDHNEATTTKARGLRTRPSLMFPESIQQVFQSGEISSKTFDRKPLPSVDAGKNQDDQSLKMKKRVTESEFQPMELDGGDGNVANSASGTETEDEDDTTAAITNIEHVPTNPALDTPNKPEITITTDSLKTFGKELSQTISRNRNRALGIPVAKEPTTHLEGSRRISNIKYDVMGSENMQLHMLKPHNQTDLHTTAMAVDQELKPPEVAKKLETDDDPVRALVRMYLFLGQVAGGQKDPIAENAPDDGEHAGGRHELENAGHSIDRKENSEVSVAGLNADGAISNNEDTAFQTGQGGKAEETYKPPRNEEIAQENQQSVSCLQDSVLTDIMELSTHSVSAMDGHDDGINEDVTLTTETMSSMVDDEEVQMNPINVANNMNERENSMLKDWVGNGSRMKPCKPDELVELGPDENISDVANVDQEVDVNITGHGNDTDNGNAMKIDQDIHMDITDGNENALNAWSTIGSQLNATNTPNNQSQGKNNVFQHLESVEGKRGGNDDDLVANGNDVADVNLQLSSNRDVDLDIDITGVEDDQCGSESSMVKENIVEKNVQAGDIHTESHQSVFVRDDDEMTAQVLQENQNDENEIVVSMG